MRHAHFPDLIRDLPDFEGQFDAHQLHAGDCEVLFASYPAGTTIDAHSHPTHNVGVITQGRLELTMYGDVTTYGPGDWYEVPANQQHAAHFEVETSEIEFWFATTV